MTDDFKKELGRLRETFYQAFDQGRLTDAFVRLASGRPVMGFEEIGCGMHFRCWRDRQSVAGMSMVVKVSTSELMAELGNPESWISSLKGIKPGIPLVPPFELLYLDASQNSRIGMVMPYGEGSFPTNSPLPEPTQRGLRVFYTKIKELGMELGDVPQIRTWDGIPFIVDLSDLRTRTVV